ncbi:MAG: hypothetical protein A2X64_01185 [Ignavibacteria bacterium GWF2_33_9]|nr:MAG: hypothetical protein A2X64_01185 [Ignavibacteria bacterium GWF2_33_9]
MKKLLFFAIVLFCLQSEIQGQYTEIHCKHFLYGYPVGSPATNDLIIRDIYALSSNDSTKFADWVAYRLDKETLTGPSQQKRKWAADPWLDDNETLEPNDYKDAPKILKIDRGHQAPLANFKGTKVANETNYLSNITPQKSELNQGVWKNLEEKERELTETFDLVYVMTGTLYEKTIPNLPKADENHKVPSGYWKIIAIPFERDISDLEQLQIFGFIFDQETPRKDPIEKHLVSINEIEKIAKLDFFNELDSKIQWKLESKPNPNYKIFFEKLNNQSK